MIVQSENDKPIYYKVLQFIENHLEDYDRFEVQGILSYAKNPNIEICAKVDVVREIFDELGLIPDDLSLYIAFINAIDKEFGIDGKHIYEVGGGILPRLAKRIHLRQKSGSITVFDPRLAHDVMGKDRFILRREKFTKSTPTQDADLLIGLMPCKGAEALLDNACAQKKDFMLWLCEGGPHGDYFDYFESDDEWLDSTIFHAKRFVERNHMGKLKALEYPQFSDYPIIYNQR